MKIYLAGPDVFLPDAVEIGRRKVDICAAHGLTGLYPLDNAIDLPARDASWQIFCGTEAMMDAADAIIANLTPFRGAGADPGTVYELGYMAGRGKFCLAYSNDGAAYADRVSRVVRGWPGPVWRARRLSGASCGISVRAGDDECRCD